jgi:ubiquinone/menaquinone biosynthesis C-methylase UbiE
MGVAERIQGANQFEAGKLSPYWGEHVSRYIFALQFVENKDVLDVACGTGYGLPFLRGKASRVVGVDASEEALLEAKNVCDDKTSVLLADALRLPFPDKTFDVVTSFETIEHLHERQEFLREIKRVLKINGLLVLSTPNANYTKPVNGKPTNPFHVFEYTPEELEMELRSHFLIESFLGQKLSNKIKISPFYSDQIRMSKDPLTQTKLFLWRVMNKLPVIVREKISEILWKRPFYPTESDYEFDQSVIEDAPVLLAVCRKVS